MIKACHHWESLVHWHLNFNMKAAAGDGCRPPRRLAASRAVFRELELTGTVCPSPGSARDAGGLVAVTRVSLPSHGIRLSQSHLHEFFAVLAAAGFPGHTVMIH